MMEGKTIQSKRMVIRFAITRDNRAVERVR